jgi:hypothetical protein
MKGPDYLPDIALIFETLSAEKDFHFSRATNTFGAPVSGGPVQPEPGHH